MIAPSHPADWLLIWDSVVDAVTLSMISDATNAGAL